MLTERVGLMASILYEPEEDTIKLAHADWLDENNRSDDARLYRDLCDLRRGKAVEPYPTRLLVLMDAVRGFHSPVKKLSKLTAFQQSLLPWFTQAGLCEGLMAEPCDRTVCETAASLAYTAAGLKPPTKFVWMDGPLYGSVAAAELCGTESQVESQVRLQVGSQVRSQVESQVRSQVGSQVGSQVRSQVWTCGYGQQDAAWLAYYAAMWAFGLESLQKLGGLWGLLGCGWWWPFTDICVLTERPTELVMEKGKLVVVKYGDGLVVDNRGR